MKLFKTSLYSAVAVSVRLISSFIVAKTLAVFVGVSGFALFGQFMIFCQMLQVFAGNMVQVGVTKYTAEREVSLEQLRSIISNAYLIVLISSIMICLTMIVFGKSLSIIVLGNDSYYIIFIVLGFFLLPYGLNSIWLGVLNGVREIKLYSIINISTSVVFFIIVSVLSFFWVVPGSLTAMATGQSFILIITILLLKNKNFWIWTPSLNSISKSGIIKLLKFSSMSFTTALILPTSQIFLRTYLSHKLSWVDVGYWQAVSRVSDAYLLFFTTTLTTYFLPKFSSISSTTLMKRELKNGYKFLVPIVIAVAIMIFIFKHNITILLYSDMFTPMEILYKWQLIGDVVKVCAWMLSYVLLAKSMTKIFIFCEVFFTFSYVIFTIIFTNYFGLIGTVYAFTFNFVIYLIFLVIATIYLNFGCENE